MPQEISETQLVDFEHAAAGHPGVRVSKSGEILIKPCKEGEIDFYHRAQANEHLKLIIPTFYGKLDVGKTVADAGTIVADLTGMDGDRNVLAPPAQPAAEVEWSPSNGVKIVPDCHIVMQNVCHGFRKPNVLDVKLGARLWADDAPPAKRTKLDLASDRTTSRPLGFRIAGMTIWAGDKNAAKHKDTNGYRKYEKHYGKGLKAENVQEGFELYFFNEEAGIPKEVSKEIIREFLKHLAGIKAIMETEETRMYSASLLFVYEGDGEQLLINREAEKERSARGDDSDRSSFGDAPIPAAELEKLMADAGGPLHKIETDNVVSNHVTAADGGTGGETGQNLSDAKLVFKLTNDTGSDEANVLELAASESSSESMLPIVQTVKLIDFAHARFAKGQGPDENVLHGIRSVIDIFEKLLV